MDHLHTDDHGRHMLRASMSVEVKRIFPRIAACCVLAVFAAASWPPGILADEFASPNTAQESEGILCMDDMVTEPYSDEGEPSPVSHIDGGCSISQLPIST